jgi:hypothetical protein
MKLAERGELLDTRNPIANSAKHRYPLVIPGGVILFTVAPK